MREQLPHPRSVACTVVCRTAARRDLPDVLRLYGQPDLDDGAVLQLDRAEQLYDRIASYPDYRIYVAVCDERIVGTFALLIMDNLGHLGAPSGVIEDVAVDPQWQGHGVGTAMMEHALRICAERGCYKATLSSNMKRERAHAFYEALNFERHGYSFRIATAAPGARVPARADAKD